MGNGAERLGGGDSDNGDDWISVSNKTGMLQNDQIDQLRHDWSGGSGSGNGNGGGQGSRGQRSGGQRMVVQGGVGTGRKKSSSRGVVL